MLTPTDEPQVNGEKMRAALTMDVLATDLADYLVRKGVGISLSYPPHCTALTLSYIIQIPFRETHHVSGRAVALAEARQCQINELTFADFKSLHKDFTEDIYAVFDFEASVERRQAIGGTSRAMVERQIAVLRAELSK